MRTSNHFCEYIQSLNKTSALSGRCLSVSGSPLSAHFVGMILADLFGYFHLIKGGGGHVLTACYPNSSDTHAAGSLLVPSRTEGSFFQLRSLVSAGIPLNGANGYTPDKMPYTLSSAVTY